ncbi:MAG: hypothetical protein HYS87_00130 [Candidatus Colwellbacteria bacterium]|nr:hypothetical protein [Candidatus Colwellbacteria bacterium]
MRLFELKASGQVPRKAGAANIEWVLPTQDKKDKNKLMVQSPHCKGRTIFLPYLDEAEFFPLRGGEQFILIVPLEHARWVLFGGTDEASAFVVRMQDQAAQILRQGEQAFYDSLKPERIKELEKNFGVTALRQGDWFCVPIPTTWENLRIAMIALGHSKTDFQIADQKKGIPIGNTRHSLCGGQVHSPNYGRGTIAEGTLRAPDHKDLVLNGPHILWRTEMVDNRSGE